MKKFLILLSIVAGLASCGDEDETFERIDFNASGVLLTSHNVNDYYGEVDAQGADITLVATGKNASNGFLSQIEVGDYIYEVTNADMEQPLPYTICQKDWGKIEIMSTSPHTTRIVLNANKTYGNINYKLTFGGGYKTSRIVLKQLKDK